VRIILVHHAEADWKRDGHTRDLPDPPLTERGRWHARRLAEHLRSIPVQAIYSSQLRRALQTAEPIAAALRLEIMIERDLAGLASRDAEPLAGSQLPEVDRSSMQRLEASNGGERRPGGESPAEAQGRIWAFIDALSRQEGVETAICVSHHFPILAAIAAAIHLPLDRLARVRQDVGCYSILDFRNGRVQVARLNENCHVAARQSIVNQAERC
jgi:broad specificity phosphatase PhoE